MIFDEWLCMRGLLTHGQWMLTTLAAWHTCMLMLNMSLWALMLPRLFSRLSVASDASVHVVPY